MPVDHRVLPDARRYRLRELSFKRLGDDEAADVTFVDAAGRPARLLFLGIRGLRLAHFATERSGYAVLDQRDLGKPDRAVRLQAPPEGGISLQARTVMSVDPD